MQAFCPLFFNRTNTPRSTETRATKKTVAPTHPPTHTEPGIDLKLLTRHRGRLPIGGYLGGVITHDGEGHYSFVESAGEGRWIPQQRNPHIYEGRFVNVNRRPDGSLYPSLTRPPYTEVFTFRHFCLAAAEELRMVADMIG